MFPWMEFKSKVCLVFVEWTLLLKSSHSFHGHGCHTTCTPARVVSILRRAPTIYPCLGYLEVSHHLCELINHQNLVVPSTTFVVALGPPLLIPLSLSFKCLSYHRALFLPKLGPLTRTHHTIIERLLRPNITMGKLTQVAQIWVELVIM